MLYLDTSALVKLAVAEAETRALTESLGRDAAELFSSVIGGTEVARALHARRLGDHARRIAHSSGRVLLFPGFVVRLAPLTPEIAHHAGTLVPGRPLRSLDALHLATALAIGPSLTAVVTYDVRMAEAARALGLRVTAPRGEDSPGRSANEGLAP